MYFFADRVSNEALIDASVKLDGAVVESEIGTNMFVEELRRGAACVAEKKIVVASADEVTTNFWSGLPFITDVGVGGVISTEQKAGVYSVDSTLKKRFYAICVVYF